MKFSFCSFLTVSLKVEIIFSEICWTVVSFASHPLTPHIFRQAPSHEWSFFFTKCKVIFCQKGTSTTAPLTRFFSWQGKRPMWCYCPPSCTFVNIECFKLQDFPVWGEKHAVCESKHAHRGASLSRKACTTHMPGKHCPSHCVGLCTVSWAWAVAFGMQMRLNILVCIQRMQGSLLAQVHLYAHSESMFSLAKAVSPDVEAHCPHWHAVLFQTLLQGVWLNSGARLYVGTCGRNCMWLKLLLRGIKYTVRGIWELRLAEGAGSCSIPCCLLGLYPLRGMATKIPVPFQSEGGGYKPSAAGLPEFKSWPYHFLASCLQTGYLIFLLVHLWNRNCTYLIGC